MRLSFRQNVVDIMVSGRGLPPELYCTAISWGFEPAIRELCQRPLADFDEVLRI
jgi:hypothetical protein